MSAYDLIRQFYFITHIDNIPSIIEKGVFSHEKIANENIKFTPIYDNEIVIRRSEKITSDGKDLWSYANLFFEPRNPMLYRVIIEKDVSNLAVIAIDKRVLMLEGVLVTTGNAASDATEIRRVKELNKTYREIKQDLTREYWKEFDGSKRRIMAECLVPDYVPPDYINCIYVSKFEAAEKLKKILKVKIDVTPEPFMFFQPDYI